MAEKKAGGLIDLGALLVLVAMVFWFGGEMVWGDKVPFFRDLGPYFYPMRFSLAKSLEAGKLPLWDRHMGMGFPLLADFQSAVFYPPHLFYLAFPFFTAVAAIFLFHYVIAAIGAYLLCRRWQYPPTLALMGATLFTLGGTIVSFTNVMNHFQSAVWLPLVVWAWERVLASRSPKNFLLLSFLLLVQFLAGSPEIYAMSLGLLFLDGLRFRAEEAEIRYRRLFFLLLTANGLVAGLAMAQILPTVELLRESRAHHIISYDKAVEWSLHPLSIINLFFLDRQVVPGILHGMHLFFAQETSFIVSLYMGILALPGICLWHSRSSFKGKTFIWTLILVFLIIAMGGYTPVYRLLFDYIWPFDLIRFPEKFFFVVNALLLFVVLRGWSRLLQGNGSSCRGLLLILSSVCLVLLLSYLVLRIDAEPLGRFIAHTTHAPILSPSTLERTSSMFVSLERQIALTFAVLLLLFFRTKGRLRTPLFNTLVTALVFIDLASAHRPYQFLLRPDFVFGNERVLAAPDPDAHRLFYYPGPSNLHPAYYYLSKRHSFADFNSLVFRNLLPNTGIFHGFDYMQELDALGRRSYVMLLDFASRLSPERQYRLLGAMNVKYLGSFQPLPGGDLTLIRHFPETPSWLYRVNRTVPRTYIVSKVTRERDPLKILARLSSEGFDPRREVILGEPRPHPVSEDFKAEARFIRYGDHRVTIQASLNGAGVLVLADFFYPGWRVYVDGMETEILRANFFFRGVALPAGEHVVEFRYEPHSFTIGAAISILTLCGVVVWIILAAIYKRRRNTGELVGR